VKSEKPRPLGLRFRALLAEGNAKRLELARAKRRNGQRRRVGSRTSLSDLLVRTIFMSEVSGRYLLEALFGPGARNNWQDTVLGVTGERLNPDYFVTSLS
jgi:hypothetical protein